jgi:hypothetical protein
MHCRALSSCLSAACLAGCSSTSNGTVAIEARGAMTIESAGTVAAGALASAGGYSGGAETQGLGFGVGAAINTTVVDVIGGYDQRKYDGHEVPETSIGLRKRFGPDKSPVYAFALARSTQNGTDGEVVFNGTALGLGLIVQFHPHWFVDMSMALERTSHLDIDPERSRHDQGVFQIGVGYAF